MVVLLTSHDNKGVLAYSFGLLSQPTSDNVLAIALKDTGMFRGRRTLDIDGRNIRRAQNRRTEYIAQTMMEIIIILFGAKDQAGANFIDFPVISKTHSRGYCNRELN